MDRDSNRIENSSSEGERKKKAIFDSMSEKRQKHILNKGYEKWDPFLEPKDPLDIRKEKTGRTGKMLVDKFMRSKLRDDCSDAYIQGVVDICMGIVSGDERRRGMYEFACWHKELLKREGFE